MSTKLLFLAMVGAVLSVQYMPTAIFARVPSLYSSTIANMTPLWRQQAVVAAYKEVKPATAKTVAAVVPGDFSFPFQRRWVSVDEMAALLTDSAQERREVSKQLGELITTMAEELKQGGTPYGVSNAAMKSLQPDRAQRQWETMLGIGGLG
jgi:hypothetical protein